MRHTSVCCCSVHMYAHNDTTAIRISTVTIIRMSMAMLREFLFNVGSYIVSGALAIVVDYQ